MFGVSKKQYEEWKAENTEWFKEIKENLAQEELAKPELLETSPTKTSTTTFGLPNEQYKEWVDENTKFFQAAKAGNLESFCDFDKELTFIEEIEKNLAEKILIRSLTNDGNVKCWSASSAVSSPVTTEPKVSSDAISNSDNKETDSTDTVSEITVVTELASDREDSSIILPPSENADNTNELENEDESYDDLVSSSDESNIDIPEYTEVEPTGSLKGVYSSANSSNSFTSSSVEPVELRVTDNNSLGYCYNKISSFCHSIADGFSHIADRLSHMFSSTNASVSEGATFYVPLDSDEVKDKVGCSGEALDLGAVSSIL